MINHNTVEVIIPCKNGQKWLEGALQSIYSQSFLPKRVLIIDDHSTQPITLDKLKIEIKVRTEIFISAGQGLSAARNTGINLSTAEYLAFLDVDDRWDERKLKQQMDLFCEFPADVANFCEYYSVDVRGKILISHTRDHLLSTTEGLITERTPVLGSASSILVKRDAILSAGSFDEKLNYAEDLDCWIRLAKKGVIRKVPARLVFITENPDSMQRKVSSSQKYHLEITSKIRIYEKHHEFQDLGLANIIETLNMALLRRALSPLDIYRYLQELIRVDLLERHRFLEYFKIFFYSFCRLLYRGVRYKSKKFLILVPFSRFIWKLIKYLKYRIVTPLLKQRKK